MNGSRNEIYICYDKHSWTWCADLIIERFGNHPGKLTTDQLAKLIDDWCTSSINLNNNLPIAHILSSSNGPQKLQTKTIPLILLKPQNAAEGKPNRLRLIQPSIMKKEELNTLDQKALTYLSLDTMKTMADGQATKIIFPFELTKIADGISKYLGMSTQIEATKPTSLNELESMVGKIDDVLGPIPNPAVLAKEIDTIEEEMELEVEETAKLTESTKKKTDLKE